MARVTGLEPATSGVTGRRSNQLSYTRALAWRRITRDWVSACQAAVRDDRETRDDRRSAAFPRTGIRGYRAFPRFSDARESDRKSVGEGKSVLVSVDLGGSGIIKKK